MGTFGLRMTEMVSKEKDRLSLEKNGWRKRKKERQRARKKE